MKKLYILLVLFTPLLAFSQQKMAYNLVATYSYESQGDSTNVNSKIRTENFILYAGQANSLFISEHRIGIDTLLYNNASAADMGMLMALPQPTINKRILKVPDHLTVYDEYNGKVLSYEDKINLNWKLSPEQDTINSFNVKKAQVNFRGRDYIAWYAEDIPLADGPYKFSGLPGLIVKIYDTKQQIVYSLVGLKQFARPRKLIVDYDKDSQKTTAEGFAKAKKNFLADPIPELESQGMVFTEETKRIIRQRFEEKSKKAKNQIELTHN